MRWMVSELSPGNYEYTQKQMEKIAAKNRGRKHSQVTRDRISQAMLGHASKQRNNKIVESNSYRLVVDRNVFNILPISAGY